MVNRGSICRNSGQVRKRRVMQAVKVGDAIVHRDKIGKCRDSAPYLIYIISCIWMMLSSNMNTFNTFMLSLCYKHDTVLLNSDQ